MLAIFDVTSSIVCTGKLLGKPFKDVLGVREGAVESPHVFSIYVNDLKAHLESQHPRLCHLMGMMVAIILYADDAAIPADGAEDLQLAATLFEEFCNDSRLFISTPKSFVIVFHNASDQRVIYQEDGVSVDGVRVEIKVCGHVIAAAGFFKYLGVHLDSTCSQSTHADARVHAFDRAALFMLAGLSRIPAFPQSFVTYL